MSFSLDLLKTEDGDQIPLPTPEFFKEIYKAPEDKKVVKSEGDFKKHERAYDAFCRWSATPTELRKPLTLAAFETHWKIPKGYTSEFRKREDFPKRRLSYFWDWMMDKFPDVVYAVYKEAAKGKSKQSETFIELVAKHIKIDKPAATIQTLNIIGVSQDALNKLAVPRGYDKVIEEGEVEGGEKK